MTQAQILALIDELQRYLKTDDPRNPGYADRVQALASLEIARQLHLMNQGNGIDTEARP